MILFFLGEKFQPCATKKLGQQSSNGKKKKKNKIFFAFFGPNTAFGRSCVVCPWRLGQWHFAGRL
jgi:hypothetical protein